MTDENLTVHLWDVIHDARATPSGHAPTSAIVAAVLPILAEEVRKAKAEAWQEGANFALPGKETYWISKHNPHRATETGGQR